MSESALVDAAWLGDRIGAPSLRIVDASWYLPSSGRDAEDEYRKGHIPGAVRFDIDAISDPTSDLPHMLPTPTRFAEDAGALGLSSDDLIVVYDGAGLFSAARVWWMLKTFGAHDVRLLNGGFPAWTAAGYPVETGVVELPPARFDVRFAPGAVAARGDVADALASGAAQVVDVRGRERFAGREAEPRPGLRAGHMPGALNLPYGRLLDQDRLKPAADLRREMQDHGVALDRPIIASCGSGVTAAILCLALHEAGIGHGRLYDGSWAEWGARPDTPVATGDGP